MFPIFEQGSGKGIGHLTASFTKRFEELCQQHLHEDRARAFAFIFYDFEDAAFRAVLKDQGVFAELDRLSGEDLSVFYLHSGRRRAVERFNSTFLAKLGIVGDLCLPCLVFFRVQEDGIHDIAVAQLESADLIHGFHELYGHMERYIRDDLGTQPKESRYVIWLKSSAKFVGFEAFRAWLKIALQGLM